MFPGLSSDEIVRSLDAAVSETLETMFFAEVQPGDVAEQPLNGVRNILRFEGDQSGWFELRVSSAKAKELAANFLGIDLPDVEPVQVESVCGEMANMVCGAMLSNAAPEGHFALSHPELLVEGEGPAEHWLLRSYRLDAEALEIGLASASPYRIGNQ